MSDTVAAPDAPGNFTHLHLHTVYSLLDGAIRTKDLMSHVKSLGMSSVAMTDHGNMFGAIEFFEAAQKEGIKPIIGQEFYIAPDSMKAHKDVNGVADGQAYHLVVLAKNMTGYRNLIKLSSRGFLEGFYRKPRIDYELLSRHSEGLVATSACLAGEVNRKLLQGKEDEAYSLSGHLNEIMGKGNFFLEIQNHGIREQEIAARGSIDISKKTGIPLVLTNDAHFLKKEHQQAQDIMLRIQMNKKLDEPLEFGFNDQFYVKSPAEMALLFPDQMDAFHNTQLIADMVDLELEFGKAFLPHFDTPGGIPLTEYLKQQVEDGLRWRFPEGLSQKYRERADYELSVITSMGFEGYFLIVADFIRFARQQKIPVGPGRGSAAGSLVSYALGITSIDPLRYDLLFERFLNPSRNEMPDIDIDFCTDRREEVINYVVDKYGEDHVSQIITFGSLSARAVIKDVARVMGYDFGEINNICKNMSAVPGISLEDAVDSSPEAKKFFSSGDKQKKLWEVAKTLEGIPRNAGKHAAGVVIAPDKLENLVPVARDTKTGATISQYDKNPLEKVGLVKMDFLGLKNLTVIDKALHEIHRRHNLEIDIDRIPLDDPIPYQLLQKGKTKGVFQLENKGMTQLLIKSRPKVFEDIIACIALYRPGPLESGMTEEYVKRKNGETKVTYPHESLKDVLQDTFGTMVYQEQVMLISRIIAGFTMAEADSLRKAMGKKNMETMARLKEKFVQQSIEKGHDKKWAENLFDMMSEFGKYGFNKSHSAAYGMVTYQTAYLKAHYPVEFMKATLDADIENTSKLIGLIHESRDMGIEILPPDINESDEYFTVINEGQIRFGLLGIKGIGLAAVEEVVRVRKERSFTDILDFVTRVPHQVVNKKLLEALICCGAFDSLGYTRSTLHTNLEHIISIGHSKQKDRENGQSSLFGGDDTVEEFHVTPVAEWDSREKLKLERETLGLYLTSHPLDKYAEVLTASSIVPIEEIDDGTSEERNVTLLCVAESVKSAQTKKGKHYIKLQVSDLSGRAEIRVFESTANDARDLLREGEILVIEAKATIYRDTENPDLSMIANKIMPATEFNQKVNKSLHLYLEDSLSSEVQEKITNIKKALVKHRGNCPVYIHYKTPEGNFEVIRTHSTFYVEYNDALVETLKPYLQSDKHIAWQIANKVYSGEQELSTIA